MLLCIFLKNLFSFCFINHFFYSENIIFIQVFTLSYLFFQILIYLFTIIFKAKNSSLNKK